MIPAYIWILAVSHPLNCMWIDNGALMRRRWGSRHIHPTRGSLHIGRGRAHRPMRRSMARGRGSMRPWRGRRAVSPTIRHRTVLRWWGTALGRRRGSCRRSRRRHEGRRHFAALKPRKLHQKRDGKSSKFRKKNLEINFFRPAAAVVLVWPGKFEKNSTRIRTKSPKFLTKQLIF